MEEKVPSIGKNSTRFSNHWKTGSFPKIMGHLAKHSKWLNQKIFDKIMADKIIESLDKHIGTKRKEALDDFIQPYGYAVV